MSSFIKVSVGPDGKLHTPEEDGMKNDLAALKQVKEMLEKTHSSLKEAYI